MICFFIPSEGLHARLKEQRFGNVQRAYYSRLAVLGRRLLQGIQAYGDKVAGRFRAPHDWKRLFALGLLICNLAVIALADAIFHLWPNAYRPGQASVLSGLLLSIIMLRIGRPRLYIDWIGCGTLHVVLGILLTKDPHLSSLWSFVAFCTCLSMEALLTTWIGASLVSRGGLWLVAGGLASFLCVIAAFGNKTTIFLITPDAVLAVTLLLLGFSIIGLAMSLKQEKPMG